MINYQRQTTNRKYAEPVVQTSLINVYKSLPPYAKDEDGKIINDSQFYKRICIGKKDLQEIVDSNIESTNYYKVIDAYMACGDISLLNVRKGEYGDISSIPSNPNDLNAYVNNIKVSKKKVENKETVENIETVEKKEVYNNESNE